MARDEATLDVVRGWIAKAEADLANAEIVLRAGPTAPLDTVAYHAQQCAEKYLKALICSRGDDVPRIHDVEALLTRIDLWEHVDLTVEESRLLTDYATLTRGSGDYESVSDDEAAHAVELAGRVRSAVRGVLPEGV